MKAINQLLDIFFHPEAPTTFEPCHETWFCLVPRRISFPSLLHLRIYVNARMENDRIDGKGGKGNAEER